MSALIAGADQSSRLPPLTTSSMRRRGTSALLHAQRLRMHAVLLGDDADRVFPGFLVFRHGYSLAVRSGSSLLPPVLVIPCSSSLIISTAARLAFSLIRNLFRSSMPARSIE